MLAISDCLYTSIFCYELLPGLRNINTQDMKRINHIFRDIVPTSNFKISAMADIFENLLGQKRNKSYYFNQF